MVKFKSNKGSKLVEKIINSGESSNKLTEIFALCDAIKAGDIQPKPVLFSIAANLNPEDPIQSGQTISLLEILMKNCGASFHMEVVDSSFQETLIFFIEHNSHEASNEKLFELIQNWAFAFKSNPKYFNMMKTYDYFKRHGITFPPMVESEAMFSVDCAPEWSDGDECIRCKASFNALRRKHHCRNCGEIFCDDCSKYRSVIPKYGIQKEVRVCQSCFDKIRNPNKDKEEKKQVEFVDKNQELDKVYEENLQLALAISASEAMAVSSQKETKPAEPKSEIREEPAKPQIEEYPEDMDPELTRYLNRNYWEEKNSKLNPTAPPDSIKQEELTSPSLMKAPDSTPAQENIQSLDFKEKEELINAINQTLNSVTFRLKNSKSRGRSIEKDGTIQSSFNLLCSLTSQLSTYKTELENRRANLENLQEKFYEVKDAREAIEVMRMQNKMKLQQEQEMLAEMRRLKMKETMENLRNEKRKMIQNQLNFQMTEGNQLKQPSLPSQGVMPAGPQPFYNPQYNMNPSQMPAVMPPYVDPQVMNNGPPPNYFSNPGAYPTYAQPSAYPVSQYNQMPFNMFQPSNGYAPPPVDTQVADKPSVNTNAETSVKHLEDKPEAKVENKDISELQENNQPLNQDDSLNSLPVVPNHNLDSEPKEDSKEPEADGALISL